MSAIDLRKTLKQLYQPSAKTVVEVQVPAMRFLMIDGQGDPNVVPAYAQAVEALFSLSYAVKFALKKGPQAIDYAVMPLEGLWWADDMASFTHGDKSAWHWTLMIMQPDFAEAALIEDTRDSLKRRKALPALDALRIETFDEGRCAQVLHLGPFSEEGPTIARVHAFIAGRGRLAGRHHEIYLSDIRRAAPARWKTIVRQPMQ